MSTVIIHPAISGPGLDSLMQWTGMEIETRGRKLYLVPSSKPRTLLCNGQLVMLNRTICSQSYIFTDQTDMGERQ